MKKVFLIILYASLFFSCEEEKFSTKVIVQSYLMPGTPIIVKLNQVNTTNLTDELPASNARVVIFYNNQDFLLDEDLDKPGRYVYNGDNLKILEGAIYSLEIEYYGSIIKAKTKVPIKPMNIKTNFTELIIPSKSSFGLLLSWDKFTEYSIVSIDFLDEVNSSNEIAESLSPDYTPYYLNYPYNLNYLSVSYFDFKYYGKYSIKLTSINDEYKKLYDFRENYRYETQTLATNIENGLGIFTGASSDSILIEIKRP